MDNNLGLNFNELKRYENNTHSESGVAGVWLGALECPEFLEASLSTGTETLLLNSAVTLTAFFLSGPKNDYYFNRLLEPML